MKVADELRGVSSKSWARLSALCELRRDVATGRMNGPLASEVGR